MQPELPRTDLRLKVLAMLLAAHCFQGRGAYIAGPNFRKILLVSVKFLSAILWPEMGAPILWTPGKMRSFCRKNHVSKIPLFLGGGFWGGGGVPILFLWARGFFWEFYTPPPPHPWNYPPRGGGVYEGGGGAYKIPAAWGLKIYTPTPLPWKMPFGQNWGEGGGGDISSPWIDYHGPRNYSVNNSYGNTSCLVARAIRNAIDSRESFAIETPIFMACQADSHESLEFPIRANHPIRFESTVSEKRTHWASLSFGANSVSSAKNSVSSLWHTNNRLRGTHWVRSPELSETRKTHWVRCLKPYSPKPYSARFRNNSCNCNWNLATLCNCNWCVLTMGNRNTHKNDFSQQLFM